MSGVFAAGASRSRGDQLALQYKMYAEANRRNATVLRQRGQEISSAANEREEQVRRQGRIAAGERRAEVAQSGTGTGGSNAAAEHQAEVMNELDALNVRYEGVLARRDVDQEAGLQDWQADINEMNRTFVKKQYRWSALAGAFTGQTFQGSTDKPVVADNSGSGSGGYGSSSGYNESNNYGYGNYSSNSSSYGGGGGYGYSY